MISTKVTKIENYRDPKSDSWSAIKKTQVDLAKTPLALQPTQYIRASWEKRPYGETDSLKFATVHDSKEIAFHLEWYVPVRHERDAVAIAMPITGNPPLITMGMRDAPIHMLYWVEREKNVRSTIAIGIGTTRPGKNVGQTGVANWENGVRQIVLTRKLGQAEETAPLVAGMTTMFAIALWRGANDERAGLKAYSITWKELQLGASGGQND